MSKANAGLNAVSIVCSPRKGGKNGQNLTIKALVLEEVALYIYASGDKGVLRFDDAGPSYTIARLQGGKRC